MFGSSQPSFTLPTASGTPAAGSTNLFGSASGITSQSTAAGSTAPLNLFSTPALTTSFSTGFTFGTSAAPSSSFSFSGFKPATTAASQITGAQIGGTGPFGTSSSLGTAFCTQQQPQQIMQQQTAATNVQVNINEIASFIASLKMPQIFGDERDQIIARFNQLQAFCGTGKGFFSNSALPIDYSPSNAFCRFKTICYDRVDGSTDEEGLISFIIKRSEPEIKADLQLIIDDLFKMLGSKPQIAVNVEATKPLLDQKTELTFFITEIGVTGTKRRILASEPYSYFNQPLVRQQLTNSLMVEQILLKVVLPLEKMRDYLSMPQEGIDPLLWQQAVFDNPDPKRLLPQPIVGFQQLRERQKLQESENNVHQSCLNELFKKLERIDEQTLLKQSRIQELKSVEQKLSHRLLTLTSKYYLKIRRGYTFEMSEENLKARLDAINAQLNGTAQLKNRLAEISSNSRLAIQPLKEKLSEEPIDEDLLLEIRQYLRRCHNAIENMTVALQNDHKNLAIINQLVSS